MSNGGVLDLTIPAQPFAGEQELYDHLAAHEPVQPLDMRDPQFLYRGQQRRFLTRRWPAFDISPVVRGQYLNFESIIPTDTRHMEDLLFQGRPRYEVEERYGQNIANIRTALTINAARDTAMNSGLRNEARWIDACLSNRNIHKLLSIGQHYGLATQYVDVTSSCHVCSIHERRKQHFS